MVLRTYGPDRAALALHFGCSCAATPIANGKFRMRSDIDRAALVLRTFGPDGAALALRTYGPDRAALALDFGCSCAATPITNGKFRMRSDIDRAALAIDEIANGKLRINVV